MNPYPHQVSSSLYAHPNPHLTPNLTPNPNPNPNPTSNTAMTYSANGASVAPTFPSNFTFKLGAASAYSKLKGDADIRSGDPGQVSEAILKSLVVGQGAGARLLHHGFCHRCPS
jgi:hypothetical protein